VMSANLGPQLCNTIFSDFSKSQYGIKPTGGYFNLLYGLFVQGCSHDKCIVPSFDCEVTRTDNLVVCNINITEVPVHICKQITFSEV
jgi:hypothetical protein